MPLLLAALVTHLTVELPPKLGRVIVVISPSNDKEPRFQVNDSVDTAQIFGVDIETPQSRVTIDDSTLGYPLARLSQLEDGEYWVQAVFNVYDWHTLGDGRRLLLPPDRGEGQHWNEKPGNPYSTARKMRLQNARITLDKVIPEITPAADTKYLKHVRMQSERLSKFWGRPTFLSANVLLPEGYEAHPNARYPLIISHGHYSRDIDFRESAPEASLPPIDLAAISKECPNGHEQEGEVCTPHGYARLEQEHAHAFFKAWTGPSFPRVLLVEINHPTPYYDDSYAVNSANLGPYGDAITYELLPYLEKRFRGLGPWARAMMGGSTGGWIALANQIFYPSEYNGAVVACPDPVAFSAFMAVDLYHDDNAYVQRGRWQSVERPAERDRLGRIRSYVRTGATRELVLGTKHRSGEQLDIWEAVYSPAGADGYPRRIWDRRTGVIDREVAAYWREHYDLDHIMTRDWAKLAPQLKGKLQIYVGLSDSYYLNNAVYALEATLKRLGSDAVVDYGARDEHCWSGDHSVPNAISRLTYAQRFVPRFVEHFLRTAPKGADVSTWRY